MGQASRQKRQRRAPRLWQTVNPWTGASETFTVCIDDRGLREWERDRVRLARAGYPDRPPELDSPNARAWNPTEPGTPPRFADPTHSDGHLGCDHDARALGMWRSHRDPIGAKVLVGRRDDGTFTLQLVLETPTDRFSAPIRVPDAETARAVIDDFEATVVELGLSRLAFMSADAVKAELTGGA